MNTPNHNKQIHPRRDCSFFSLFFSTLCLCVSEDLVVIDTTLSTFNHGRGFKSSSLIVWYDWFFFVHFMSRPWAYINVLWLHYRCGI